MFLDTKEYYWQDLAIPSQSLSCDSFMTVGLCFEERTTVYKSIEAK